MPSPGPAPGPAPVVFDVVINATIPDDGRVVRDTAENYISGNNVLVDAQTVDLSPYASPASFKIHAGNLLQFADNASHFTEFSGLPAASEFRLLVVSLLAPADFSIIYNNSGSFRIDSTADLTLNGSSTSGLLGFDNPSGDLGLGAANDINVSGRVGFYGNSVYMTAGNNLTMTGGIITANSYMSLTAADTLSLNGTTFGGASTSMGVSMSARTIVLQNITFRSGSYVSLYCDNGTLAPNPNTGASVVPGSVNFVRNVFYGSSSTPAQTRVGSEINIYSRGGAY